MMLMGPDTDDDLSPDAATKEKLESNSFTQEIKVLINNERNNSLLPMKRMQGYQSQLTCNNLPGEVDCRTLDRDVGTLDAKEESFIDNRPYSGSQMLSESHIDSLPYVSPSYLAVDHIVNVCSRTWPGINKQGGVGKIVKIHTKLVTFSGDDELLIYQRALKVTHVDVKYMVNGGQEKMIDVAYVTLASEYETNIQERSLRDRALILGRCTICNALRVDCNSCDWKAEQECTIDSNKLEHSNNQDDFDEINSEEEEEFAAATLERYRKLIKRTKSQKKKKNINVRHLSEGLGAHDKDHDENMTLSALEKIAKESGQKQQRNRDCNRKWRNHSKTCSLATLPLSTVVQKKDKSNSQDNRKKTCMTIVNQRPSEPWESNHISNAAETTETLDVDYASDHDGNKETIHMEQGIFDTQDDSTIDDCDELLTPKEGYPFDDELEDNVNQEISFHGSKDDDHESVISNSRLTIATTSFESELSSEGYPSSEEFSTDNDSDIFEQMEGASDSEEIGGVTHQQIATIAYGNLIQFIDECSSEIEAVKLPHVRHQLSILKGRLTLVKRDVMNREESEKMQEELNFLLEKSNELHRYVVRDLMRKGVDQCNKAMTRLLEERKSHKYEFRKSLIELRDLRVGSLNDNVTTIDTKVTALRKDIERSIQPLIDCHISDPEDEENNFYFEANAVRPVPPVKKRKISKSDRGPHQHASKKKSILIGRAIQRSIQNSHDESKRNVKTRTKQHSVTHIYDNASTIRMQEGRVSSAHGESRENDFFGDHDFGDYDCMSSRFVSNSSIQEVLKSKQPEIRSKKSSNVQQTAADRMETWIDSQNRIFQKQMYNGTRKVTSSRDSHSSMQNTRMSRAYGETVLRSQSIEPEATNTHTKSLVEPALPKFLSVDNLFASLSVVKERHYDHNKEIFLEYSKSRSISQLCGSLEEHYPHRLLECENIVFELSKLVLSEHVQIHEVVTIFNSLLRIFKSRCSIILDLFLSNPNDTCFQLKCWCLIVAMLEREYNSKLDAKDGLAHKIFSETSFIVDHLLLQMIDFLYSQLLWKEWGATPRGKRRIHENLCQLRDHIGKVSTMLPVVFNLLRVKFGCQTWHRSRISENKENNSHEMFFVSAVNPDSHFEFLSTGMTSHQPEEGSRLSKFGDNIPRREIEALWYIIGFFSSNPTLASYSDCKDSKRILSLLLHNNCGIFPKTNQTELAPNMNHVDTCAQEIDRISALLYSRSLGFLPDFDSFSINLLEKTVVLNSYDKTLNTISSIFDPFFHKTVAEIWGVSSCESRLQVCVEPFVGMSTLTSFHDTNERSKVLFLMPSTRPLQCSARMLEAYAILIMSKKARWKRFSTSLQSMIDSFNRKADELENSVLAHTTLEDKPKPENDFGTVFAREFPSVDAFTSIEGGRSQRSAFFRESSCYVLLSCLIARKNSTPLGIDLALDKKTREKLRCLSSDDKMCDHQMFCLEMRQGKPPGHTNNLYSLYTCAKIMSFTALLHLFVEKTELEPIALLDKLNKHLISFGLDSDTSMLEYLVTLIVSSLLGCCGLQDSVNKDAVDSTKSCIEVITPISMWICCIYNRARFILGILSTSDYSFSQVGILSMAIIKLGYSRLVSFVLKSLTIALKSVVLNLPNRLSSDFRRCLDTTVRSCLAAMRNVVALFHACRMKEGQNEVSQSLNDDQIYLIDAFNDFHTFLITTVIPSVLRSDSRSHERILCRSQSGGFVSVYAAICTLCLNHSLDGSFELFCQNQTESNDDRIYLNHICACFICEISSLSHFPYCKIFASRHIGIILNQLTSSLLDSETIMEFPSCDIHLLTLTGGEDMRMIAESKISKVKIYTSMPYQNPDEEASQIRGTHEEYFDAVGSPYMTHNIWSFCNNVAKLLCEFDVDASNQKSIGQFLFNTSVELHSNSEVLDMVPSISIERECLKRFVLFRSLLSAFTQEKEHFFYEANDLSKTIVNCILEHIYFISEISSFHEKEMKRGCLDRESRFNRARGIAFQRAYLTFSGSLLALMLRDNAIKSNEIRVFVRDLIIRIFMTNENIRDIIEDAHKQHFFNFHLRKKANVLTEVEKTNLQRMNNTLRSSFLHHSDWLLAYDAECHNQGERNALLHSMISAVATELEADDSVDVFVTITSNRLILTSKAIMMNSPCSPCEIQNAIDHHFRITEVQWNDESDFLKSIVGYREWVLGSFFPKKLSAHSVTCNSQKVILKLLISMFETFSSTEIQSGEKIFNMEGNMATFHAYVKIAHSLKVCFCNAITSRILTVELMVLLVSCAQLLMSLKVSTSQITQSQQNETTTLLEWAAHAEQFDEGIETSRKAYLTKFSIWINIISQIRKRNENAPSIFYDVLTQRRKTLSDDTDDQQHLTFSSPDVKSWSLSLDSLVSLEDLLFPHDIIRQNKSNPYAKRK